MRSVRCRFARPGSASAATSRTESACPAIAIGILPLAGAQAQDAYPDKPIRVIMPWAAGGPTDVVGRVITVRLGEILSHPLW